MYVYDLCVTSIQIQRFIQSIGIGQSSQNSLGVKAEVPFETAAEKDSTKKKNKKREGKKEETKDDQAPPLPSSKSRAPNGMRDDEAAVTSKRKRKRAQKKKKKDGDSAEAPVAASKEKGTKLPKWERKTEVFEEEKENERVESRTVAARDEVETAAQAVPCVATATKNVAAQLLAIQPKSYKRQLVGTDTVEPWFMLVRDCGVTVYCTQFITLQYCGYVTTYWSPFSRHLPYIRL